MKRCPVTFHLALIIVALFADDVEFNVQLLSGGRGTSGSYSLR